MEDETKIENKKAQEGVEEVPFLMLSLQFLAGKIKKKRGDYEDLRVDKMIT
jgi:hypothetical protein